MLQKATQVGISVGLLIVSRFKELTVAIIVSYRQVKHIALSYGSIL